MVTALTGTTVTEIVAVAVFPSTVAVTTVVPAATAVTTPCAEMVATAGVLLLHVTGRPVSAAPSASVADAVKA